MPKPWPCLGPTLHSQGLFHLFFASPSFLLLWFCFIFQLLFHLCFIFIFFLTQQLVSQSNFIFYFVIVLFFFATPHTLCDLGSRARCRAKAPVVGAQSANHWTNREPQTPGNIHRSEVSRRSSSQHQDPALPNSLQTPGLEASGQTTSKTGTQSHSWKKTKMRQQKSMSQMKEQGKNLQDQINEEEIGNLPEKNSE